MCTCCGSVRCACAPKTFPGFLPSPLAVRTREARVGPLGCQCYTVSKMLAYRPNFTTTPFGSPPSQTECKFDFVEKVPARFTCTICANVLKNPHLTECCGQHYCKTCLTQWLGKSSHRGSCPQCRADRVTHMVNKSLEREIEELQVRCTNRGKGCRWVGEKGALSGHLKSDSGCKYEEVKCTLGKCGKKMERKLYKIHIEEKCSYRPYQCLYCGHKDTFKAIVSGDGANSHYSECPRFPLACPNKCGDANVIRKDLPSHRENCPLEKIPCPYMETGCVKGSILRKDLHSHLENNIQQHMLGLLKAHSELKEKVKTCRCNKVLYFR